MKKAEKVLGILFVVSGSLAYGSIPFGKVLLTLFGLILCIYYGLGGFLLFNNISVKAMFKKAGYTGIGVSTPKNRTI